MLRNRSRAVTSKQVLMTDHTTQSSSIQNYTKPIQSFLGSPRFKAFTFKGMTEAEPVMSPTSILEPFKIPFWYEPRSPKVFLENKHSWENLDTKGIGVALIAGDHCNNPDEKKKGSFSKTSNRMVLFGTKLKVQIPSPENLVTVSEAESSPGDFGTKTRINNHPGFGNSGIQTKASPKVFTGCLTMSELELSEDYTCVISYGPNPKTTHIFDNYVFESCLDFSHKSNSSRKNFLSFCHTCNKNLEQKNDIFIYRGEKAFCSQECRYQEILIDGIES